MLVQHLGEFMLRSGNVMQCLMFQVSVRAQELSTGMEEAPERVDG
jgi:hypothetical protein